MLGSTMVVKSEMSCTFLRLVVGASIDQLILVVVSVGLLGLGLTDLEEVAASVCLLRDLSDLTDLEEVAVSLGLLGDLMNLEEVASVGLLGVYADLMVGVLEGDLAAFGHCMLLKSKGVLVVDFLLILDYYIYKKRMNYKKE
jgi:hypothetical protein